MSMNNNVHSLSPWKPSRYNLLVPVEGGGGAAYNAASGACLDLGEADFQRITNLLEDRSSIDFALLEDRAIELGGALLAGGFVVDSGIDELTALRDRGQGTKEGGPLVLTISPTFACNLDCGYCFVGKKQGTMSIETEREVLAFARRYLEEQDVPGIEVDWFGGEPLIAHRNIKRMSQAFMEMCAEYGVPYAAQIISNGTLLSPEIADELLQCGVDRIQITIDGFEDTHNQRRPWKHGERKRLPILGAETPAKSSFTEAMRGVEAAIGKFAVRLRINVDRNNLDQAFGLLEVFDARGWLRPELRFYPYLAPVRDYTAAARTGWSMEEDCGTDAFYQAYARWLDILNERGIPVVKESLYGYPEPRSQPCGAVTERNWLINEDGTLHKCGLDIDTDARSVGRLGEQLDANNQNTKFWQGYDFFADATCRECRALPLCLGGCARDRREGREQAVSENCQHHLTHEPRILAQHVRLARANRQRRLPVSP
jgi:uncharacterized protein